jgi:hypothetical protein
MRAWTWYRGQAAWAQVAVALIATLALLGAVIGMWALIVAMTSTALPA